MERNIQQTILTQELKEHIYAFFNKHCIATVGINGYTEAPISFEIRNGDILIGCIVVQMFWGQAHIKYLIVEEKYRNQGIATKLMKHVFDYAKSRGCNLVFVETMNFQAPEFYKKLGFKVEMKREGYAKNTSFYYLYKNLNLKQNQNITTKALELPNIPIIFDAFAKANWQKYSSIFETYFQEQQKPGSKMKCNSLECLLKTQAQKGVANEKISPINSMGKNKDSDVKAIGVIINEDCRSA